MRKISILVAAFLTTVCLHATPKDDVKLIATSDPQIQAAKVTSRRTLDQFLRIHSAPPFDADTFQVKVEFTYKENTELMWVQPFRKTADGFEGILKNQPRDIPSLQWGQQVRFQREQIADWGYAQRGKTYGHFTTCVLFERGADADSLKAKKDRGFVCDRTGQNISPNSK